MKFGIARVPENRIKALQTGCPFQLKRYLEIPCGCRSDASAIEAAVLTNTLEVALEGEWRYLDAIEAGEAVLEAMRQLPDTHKRVSDYIRKRAEG